MSGRHRALTRRPWWQVALAPSRRRTSSRRRGRGGAGPASTLLLAAGGLAGVLVGSTLDPGAGTALMVTASLLPPAVLGTALARTRTALEHETRHRHRLAGRVAAADQQLGRLGHRVEDLADRAQDQAAEAERTRAGLRQARGELATARAALAGVHEQTGRVEDRRSVASVDLRIFDAFVEADMTDEHAVLDAPARRGRHAAAPAVDLTSTAGAPPGVRAERAADRSPETAGAARRGADRDVA